MPLGKKQVRQSLQSLLTGLDTEYIKLTSRLVSRHVLSLEQYHRAKSLCFFASMGHEFDTSFLLGDALDRGRVCFLPRVLRIGKKDAEMVMLRVYSLEDFNTFEKNAWGIPEPPDEVERREGIQDVDVIVMPGMAFDRQGHRLGYGKGFYDRFIHSCPRKPLLIAPVLPEQLIEKVPVDPWDVSMDFIVTLEGSIEVSDS